MDELESLKKSILDNKIRKIVNIVIAERVRICYDNPGVRFI